ncbi:MAG TPA: rhomboid family intramembrane serine protease [Spirochaetia bacterium]|nr:rhomboid family intramembrane serine protease [Spirochaetia bacterium]
MKLRIRYNAPVVLTYALLCAVVLLIDQISGGVFIRSFFLLTPDFNAGSFLSWMRMVTYVIGHANWTHLISNFSFILLIGPVLEEKYGSLPILAMMLVTALATAALNLLLVHTGLYGASGIVFMLVLLSSFTNIRQGEIPLTFILIVALYLVREFVNALAPSTVSQLAHIAGGLIGGAFGFLFSRPPKKPDLPAATEAADGKPGKE